MKKNIVVCCLRMLVMMQEGHVTTDYNLSMVGLRGRPQGPLVPPTFDFCPWCGKELPFPYKDENDA